MRLRKKEVFSRATSGFDVHPQRVREQEPNLLPDCKVLDGNVSDALSLAEERKKVYLVVAELGK